MHAACAVPVGEAVWHAGKRSAAVNGVCCWRIARHNFTSAVPAQNLHDTPMGTPFDVGVSLQGQAVHSTAESAEGLCKNSGQQVSGLPACWCCKTYLS